MNILLVAFLTAVLALAQDHPSVPAPAPPKAANPAPEKPTEIEELTKALREAGNSPKDYTRVLEAHLAKYPDTKHRDDIEAALAKSAVDAKDDARIVKYGERVIARDPADIQMIDRVTRAYLNNDDRASAEKALSLANKYQEAVTKLRAQPAPGRLSAGQWAEDLDHATARALLLKARASGLLDRKQEAIDLARTSFQMFPNEEAAREQGKWLAASGDLPAAVEQYANAFSIEDPHSTEIDRAKDRRKLGELYTKLNGSEKGLGDLMLHAYDAMSVVMADHIARLKSKDPNVQAASLLDFTLPGVAGNSLPLSTLKGKTVVLDFWATWCGPCKAQRPLYLQVESKYKQDPDVVFVQVNTDEDRTLVEPFVKSQKWPEAGYFDGGLADFMKVNSLPTTLIVDKSGQVSSRMAGFIPERFVDLLTQRIEESRNGPVKNASN
jgi:thiol-disulfide isomerase/thioredoxin